MEYRYLNYTPNKNFPIEIRFFGGKMRCRPLKIVFVYVIQMGKVFFNDRGKG